MRGMIAKVAHMVEIVEARPRRSATRISRVGARPAQISKERHMTKLNEIQPREGSTKNRMRVGRGPGSGKGKTAGRGVKGQKARSGVAIAGFEGGQMPLHMRMPKRGFNIAYRKDFAEVNLWRLEQAIAAGKLDAKKASTRRVLKAGVIRRAKDGVRLLGKGELKTKLNITVYSATASARQAVEKAGGKLTAPRRRPRPPRPKGLRPRRARSEPRRVLSGARRRVSVREFGDR